MDRCATTHPRPRPHPPPIKRIHPHTAARPPQLGDRGVGATQPARALTQLTRPPTRRLERVGPRELLLMRRHHPMRHHYVHSRHGRDPLKRRGYFGPGCIGSASPVHCTPFRPVKVAQLASHRDGLSELWRTTGHVLDLVEVPPTACCFSCFNRPKHSNRDVNTGRLPPIIIISSTVVSSLTLHERRSVSVCGSGCLWLDTMRAIPKTA